MTEVRRDINQFFVAGINYKKTDAQLRGQFALSQEKYELLLADAAQAGLQELFVISTCNRTEIYGFAPSASLLMELLCRQTEGSLETFRDIAYVMHAGQAMEHLFHVGVGLDSQILGDYEIVGQLKQAVKFAKDRGFIGAYLERMINGVLQASKQVKSTTALSDGTVSVSFAAIQYIRETRQELQDKKILLIGTGKIGRNTCRNLVDYLPTRHITLVNRTFEKAAQLAAEMNLRCAPVENLQQEVEAADIILVATNSAEPVILKDHLEGRREKLIIDLSVPYNVEESAQDLGHITLVNVDELSRIKDATLEKRRAEIPKVKEIVAHGMAEYMEWHEMRRHVPVLRAVKDKLQSLQQCELYIAYTHRSGQPERVSAPTGEKIQKVLNGMAVKMRTRPQQGCCYLEAIHEYIATGTN